jgi:N,N'-diacetyllegionaminate synthase
MVQFGNRTVGDGQPVIITFEAGPTHSGLESAKRLVTYAAEAGADAVKFQILDPDRLVSDRAMPFDYEVLVDRETGRTERVSEPLYDLLARRAMSHSEWKALKRHADSVGLAFFATVGFEDEIDLLVGLGCDSIKIASADVNHLPLIRRAAKTGICLQLDTGNSTLGEIEVAVDTIRAEGNEDIIIHQCPSGYPARLESINLRIIRTLKQMFPYPVGYSDHTPGWEMDIAAVAMGANVVEKTITEDRTTRSIEHIMSIEPPEMTAFIRAIRNVEIALGDPRRVMLPVELKKRTRMRRSIHVRRSLQPGHQLGKDDLEYRRPGDGIPPSEAAQVAGRKLRTHKAAGERLQYSDLVW